MKINKRGHPEFVPSEEIRHAVLVMAGMGMPQERIAKAIWNPTTGKPISEMTLTKYFPDELQCGRAKVMGEFCNALYHRGIIDKDMQAIRLFFNTQMGWSENTTHNLSAKNSDGGEVVIEVKFGKQDSQDERLAALAAERKAKGNGAGLH